MSVKESSSQVESSFSSQFCCFTGADIIEKARSVDLDLGILYEAVINLSAEGLITAGCINLAAGILMEDLGLPNYFFESLTRDSLKSILASIATNIKVKEGKVSLIGRVANVEFDVSGKSKTQRVRIATEETRDDMEAVLGPVMTGRRREYYFSPKYDYYTYIILPQAISDFKKEEFTKSKFLFTLTGDYRVTPEATRARYEKFLDSKKKFVVPLIEVSSLPETNETRLMFDSNFALPQLPVLRKIFSDNGVILKRAYWEPYLGETEASSSICSVYISGELAGAKQKTILDDLRAYLSFAINDVTDLYIKGKISFREMLFAGNIIDFTHLFIYRENSSDKDIIKSLMNADQKDAFASRIHQSNKTEYVYRIIMELVKGHPDLIKLLYELFDSKFNPEVKTRFTEEQIKQKSIEFERNILVRFIDSSTSYDVFKYMLKFISCCLKTNFYKPEKRSFSFRYNDDILDPIVFNQRVYGIFFVNGHYACGTHMRAADIARGGLRLIRVTPSNYGAELDKAVLLNYALGPKAQRLKHKDICESGSKGVVIPQPIYARCGMEALYDYTEGIMDLILGAPEIVDYLGKSEMVFFGPDEGTAPLMDAISYRAKDRNYKYWRTITTGKSFGVPHDTYGILDNGDLFGLLEKPEGRTELQINGKTMVATDDMEKIYSHIGGKIIESGMTTTCVMAAFRTMIAHYADKEENLNMMMTGGPDGDLGANEIQCYKGKICLLIDAGSILFDPKGLDKKELIKIAFMRGTSPRANSLQYPVKKLSKDGFMVPRLGKNIKLPDGTIIEDGGLFHKTFLTNPGIRKYVGAADIKAFIPCGGFKDTINRENVEIFLSNFAELKYIIEGANVFFDDSARRYIATETKIKQIKDSSANKGGVFSSSIAEVLTAFLLGNDYEKYMIAEIKTRWSMIKNVMALIKNYASAETNMLIKIHEQNLSAPLFELSVQTSEQILNLQAVLEGRINEILAEKEIVWNVLENYIPSVLVNILGKERIIKTLNSEQLQPYRDAIISKKLAAMAFYKYGLEWNNLLKLIEKDLKIALNKIVGQ